MARHIDNSPDALDINKIVPIKKNKSSKLIPTQTQIHQTLKQQPQ